MDSDSSARNVVKLSGKGIDVKTIASCTLLTGIISTAKAAQVDQ
jgi:hypothetical protein